MFLIKKIVDVVIILFAVSISFEALVWSQVVIAVFEMIVNLTYSKKPIGLGLLTQLKSLGSILICSVLMTICVIIVSSQIDNNLIQLINFIIA